MHVLLLRNSNCQHIFISCQKLGYNREQYYNRELNKKIVIHIIDHISINTTLNQKIFINESIIIQYGEQRSSTFYVDIQSK